MSNRLTKRVQPYSGTALEMRMRIHCRLGVLITLPIAHHAGRLTKHLVLHAYSVRLRPID